MGAKDWKYNNDYVEGDDVYRHSKWLAFMERRLLLTKELLILASTQPPLELYKLDIAVDYEGKHH